MNYVLQLKCAISTCLSVANPQNQLSGNSDGVQVPLFFCDAHMVHIVALQRQQQMAVVQDAEPEPEPEEAGAEPIPFPVRG
jgi:hypothetical protein